MPALLSLSASAAAEGTAAAAAAATAAAASSPDDARGRLARGAVTADDTGAASSKRLAPPLIPNQSGFVLFACRRALPRVLAAQPPAPAVAGGGGGDAVAVAGGSLRLSGWH